MYWAVFIALLGCMRPWDTGWPRLLRQSCPQSWAVSSHMCVNIQFKERQQPVSFQLPTTVFDKCRLSPLTTCLTESWPGLATLWEVSWSDCVSHSIFPVLSAVQCLEALLRTS